MHSNKSVQVTFIIPTLNSESTIRECLASIFAQTIGAGRFEVLLIDNGSTDKTVSIAKEKGATVLEGPCLTVAGLRNLGARNSHGNILAFVDSDCVISPEWLRNRSRKWHVGSKDLDDSPWQQAKPGIRGVASNREPVGETG
jgi:glycosyltransferase involved in cell wall biosynthesis